MRLRTLFITAAIAAAPLAGCSGKSADKSSDKSDKSSDKSARHTDDTPPPAPAPVAQPAPALPPATKLDGLLSPDGSLVATYAPRRDLDPEIEVWSTKTQRPLYSLQPAGFDRVIFGATAAGDPRLVFVLYDQPAGAADRPKFRLEVYDALANKQAWSQPLDGELTDLVIDHGGTLTTLDEHDSLMQWDMATGASLHKATCSKLSHPEAGDAEKSRGLSVAADGKTAAIEHGLYDTATCRSLATLPDAVDYELSPDGQLAAGIDQAGTVALYGRDGKPRGKLEHAGDQIQFLDDGKLMSFNDEQFILWDPLAAKQLTTFYLQDHVEAMAHLAGELTTGGAMLCRRFEQLVVLQIKTGKPVEVVRLGRPAVPQSGFMAWSRDGKQLIFNAANVVNEVLAWSTAGTVAVNTVQLPANTDPGAAFYAHRVFVLDDKGRAVRYVEAPELVLASAASGKRVFGAAASGKIYVWDADSREGLGVLASDAKAAPMTAVALRPDGRLAAIARRDGNIELWDLPSHTLRMRLAVWHDGAQASTPDGNLVAAGQAALLLDHPADAPALAPTPKPAPPPAPACVPAGLAVQPLLADIDKGVATFCVGPESAASATTDYQPYCFSTPLSTPKLDPAAPSAEALSGEPRRTAPDPSPFVSRPYPDHLDVCDAADPSKCKSLPLTVATDHTGGDDVPVSDDGTLVALRHRGGTEVEVWDVAGGKQVAKFQIQFATGPHVLHDHWMSFLGHAIVLSSDLQCGDHMCSASVVYSAQGKRLGELATSSHSIDPIAFHDDLWLLHDNGDLTGNPNAGFAIQDASSGQVIARVAQAGGQTAVAASPDYVVAALGNQDAGTLAIYNSVGKQTAKLKAPVCAGAPMVPAGK